MKVVDAIAEILKREGVEFLSTYPTTPLIDAVAATGIRPVLCRQERVGVGIADGFSRTTNGRRLGVFAMQYGPGAENALPESPRRIPIRCRSWCCLWGTSVIERRYFRCSARRERTPRSPSGSRR